MATIVLGAHQFIEEAECSLHDAIMIVRRALKNSNVVAGGGAIDSEAAQGEGMGGGRGRDSRHINLPSEILREQFVVISEYKFLGLYHSVRTSCCVLKMMHSLSIDAAYSMLQSIVACPPSCFPTFVLGDSRWMRDEDTVSCRSCVEIRRANMARAARGNLLLMQATVDLKNSVSSSSG